MQRLVGSHLDPGSQLPQWDWGGRWVVCILGLCEISFPKSGGISWRKQSHKGAVSYLIAVDQQKEFGKVCEVKHLMNKFTKQTASYTERLTVRFQSLELCWWHWLIREFTLVISYTSNTLSVSTLKNTVLSYFCNSPLQFCIYYDVCCCYVTIVKEV